MYSMRFPKSFLSLCVDRGMFDAFSDPYPENDVEFQVHAGVAFQCANYVHPLDRVDQEESDERRRAWNAWAREALIKAVGCEKTVRVLLAVTSGEVTQAEIARFLDVPPYRVCREIKRLHRRIASRF